MSEKQRLNWADMRPEDFEAPPAPEPAPPGQMELFEPGPGVAKAKVGPRAECPVGTMSLLEIEGQER